MCSLSARSQRIRNLMIVVKIKKKTKSNAFFPPCVNANETPSATFGVITTNYNIFPRPLHHFPIWNVCVLIFPSPVHFIHFLRRAYLFIGFRNEHGLVPVLKIERSCKKTTTTTKNLQNQYANTFVKFRHFLSCIGAA